GGLLKFEAARPSLYGLEMHLARMNRDIEQFRPSIVVIDPVSALRGPANELQATLLRMVDMLKSRGITAVFTSLRTDGAFDQAGDLGLSSMMDAWIKLQDVDANGERTRTLYVIKARGMSHSNQVREFQMSASGVRLVDAYVGPAGVLTGTARIVQEAEEQAALQRRRQDSQRRRREVLRRRESLERQIAELRANLELADEEEQVILGEDETREAQLAQERRTIAGRRGVVE
ncbi:MAG: ATPase domain-containing protein, partial [Methylobacterium sp.]